MQRLGTVLHISQSRNIVTKAESPPKAGATVVDENLKIVGKVFDMIGPVSLPYALVKPIIGDPEKLVGRKLYVSPQRGERRR